MPRLRALLVAVSDELAEIRAQVEDVSGLTHELLAHCPAEGRADACERIQAFDLLIQRLDGLSGLSAALGAGVAVDTALHALTLSDQFNRLAVGMSSPFVSPAVTPVVSPPPPAASGDLMLFD